MPANVAAPRPQRTHDLRADRHNLTARALPRAGDHRRSSCGSIKTAILSSRPACADAVARSGGPGCPKDTAVGGAASWRAVSTAALSMQRRTTRPQRAQLPVTPTMFQRVGNHQPSRPVSLRNERAGYARFFTAADTPACNSLTRSNMSCQSARRPSGARWRCSATSQSAERPPASPDRAAPSRPVLSCCSIACRKGSVANLAGRVRRGYERPLRPMARTQEWGTSRGGTSRGR